jgi:hypothetical protein
VNDHDEVLVALDAREETAPMLAERARLFLVERGVIRATPLDADLADDTGTVHPPGVNAAASARIGAPDPADPHVGVLFTVERQMTPVIEDATELRCGSCAAVIDVTEDDGWYEAADAWDTGNDDAVFVCPRCGVPTKVAEWEGPSAWGFGWLAICFRNWPSLSPEFVAEVAGALGTGHRVRRVFVRF